VTVGAHTCGPEALQAHFGQIDIYLFDQLLRGRVLPTMKVLDAGCGRGRNVHYLMRCGTQVHGVDSDPASIEAIRSLAAGIASGLPAGNFRVAELTDLPFPDASFDCVICSAVLHFARDEHHFEGMLREMWRVLSAGGLFFARLASTIGVEDRVRPLGGRRHALPDGTERFLVDEAYLVDLAKDIGGGLLDPLKTTNVQGMRAMTTWVLAKGAA
jgi:SAM-dependent methyltransferase